MIHVVGECLLYKLVMQEDADVFVSMHRKYITITDRHVVRGKLQLSKSKLFL